MSLLVCSHCRALKVSATEPEDRSVIGETGVVRLFEEQLSLGLTGVSSETNSAGWSIEPDVDSSCHRCCLRGGLMPLTADASTNTTTFSFWRTMSESLCSKILTALSTARLRRIDTPAKLSVWLDKLQANTLAIQQHKRFLSEGSDGGEQQTLTMRVPAEYKKFYRFCFGALREPTGDHMPTSTALKLWEVILAPFFETGADIIQFIQVGWCLHLLLNNADAYLNVQADHDDNSRTSKAEWNALLDFSQQVVLSTKEGAALVGHDTEGREWPGVIGKYITWVAEGRPDALSEMSEAESSAMEE